jgi:hypothetical protein
MSNVNTLNGNRNKVITDRGCKCAPLIRYSCNVLVLRFRRWMGNTTLGVLRSESKPLGKSVIGKL